MWTGEAHYHARRGALAVPWRLRADSGLARASRGELAAAEEQPTVGFCPRCGTHVAAAATDEPATCGRCGARFLVSYLKATEPRSIARASD
jgi:DNA-directed RNA polymerase subunit RPC12/RpoP